MRRTKRGDRLVRGACRAALDALAVAGLVATVSAQAAAPRAPQTPEVRLAAPRIEIVSVRGNVYLLAGAGANIVVSAGPDGVFMVDSGSAGFDVDVLAALQLLQRQIDLQRPPLPRWGAETQASTLHEPYLRGGPPKPIRYIANTTSAADHVGGNLAIATTGKTFTGGNVAGDLGDVGEGAAILAHENLLNRLARTRLPSRALPTETYFGRVMKLSHFFNGEGVQLIHLPRAATDGDSAVHFRGSDVVATGDVFMMEGYPRIDLENGGSIQGVLDALNRLLEMAVAEFRSEGGTLFVGGHGRIGDTADLAYYRDMCTIIRDRVQSLTRQGKTLQQIKAAKPSEDWDARFGTAAWTGDMFVEAIYESLAKR